MTTVSQKRAIRKYHTSPKGRAALARAQQRYRQTGRGKLSRASYLKSEKGKQAQRASRRRRKIMTTPIG